MVADLFVRNMTWNGAQGFQTPIEPESFKLQNFGVFGNEHTERGLTCTFVNSSQRQIEIQSLKQMSSLRSADI